MEKIIMLGTGNGGTLELYNTCFVIQNDNGNFLVDTGRKYCNNKKTKAS